MMKINRDVIFDLLPLYVSGEASPATMALVEEYASQDMEVLQELRRLKDSDPLALPIVSVPPELAMRSLNRTKFLLAWQRWLLGPAMFFTLVSLSFEISTTGGRIRGFHLLLRDSPLLAGSLAIGICCWVAYFMVRRRLSFDRKELLRDQGRS